MEEVLVRHWVSRRALVLVLIPGGAAFISLMFSVNNYECLWVLAAAIVLVGIVLLVRGIRREGWHYPVRLMLSVRMRLTIWYIIALAVVLAVFAIGIYYTEKTYLYDDLNKQLDTRLQQIAASYDPQTSLLDYQSVDGATIPAETLPGKSQTLGGFPGKEIILLLALDGTVKQQPTRPLDSVTLRQLVRHVLHIRPKINIAGDNIYPAIQMSLSFDLPNGRLASGMYTVTSMPILRRQHPVALLVVGIMNDVPAQLDTLTSALWTFAPLVLVIAAIGGFWLAGLSMRPVQTIMHAAQQISESDLSRRLKLQRRDELGELAATFDHMLDRLESAFMRQTQFTADASHELRTPLTIVNLETNRLLAQPTLSPEQRQSLMTIQQENSAMARLVQNLLLLARADAGPSRAAIIRHEEVDLGEVVLDVVERMASLAQSNRLQIVVAPLPDVTIRGDRIYLVQMLGNIVENALKYGAPSGTCVQISLENQRKSGDAWAVLRIRDDGPGIADEHLPRLFDRFYRVDSSRTHNAHPENETLLAERGAPELPSDHAGPTSASPDLEGGNGLGLAIVKWIAEAHGGKVLVQSQIAIGTTFEVLLPYI